MLSIQRWRQAGGGSKTKSRNGLDIAAAVGREPDQPPAGLFKRTPLQDGSEPTRGTNLMPGVRFGNDRNP